MKRKIKFPLRMKDGIEVRSISELREHFDMEKVIQYFFNGKLKNWLRDIGYKEELEKISELEESSEELIKSLCEVIGVDYANYKIDKSIEEIKEIGILKNIEEEKFSSNEFIDDVGIHTEKQSYIVENMSEYICRKYGKDKLSMYKDTLSFIDDIYYEIQNKLIESEKKLIDDSIIYSKFDILEDILVKIRNSYTNTYKVFEKIYKLPLDIKVKFIFLILGDINKELSSLSIDEAAGFYVVFQRVLLLEQEDFQKLYGSGDFALSLSRVMVRHREIFTRYLDSKYHRY